MTWQSGLPRVETMPARPCSVTPRKRCGWTAVRAAVHPHRFLGVTEQGLAGIVSTRGNPDCHVILRGGVNGPNYDAISVQKTLAALRDAGLPPPLMIDTSHGNSDKDYRRQPLVAHEIGAQVAQGEAGIVGVMMESFISDGRQDLEDPRRLVYGQSITDACMGWEMTVPVLRELAAAVQARRAARATDPRGKQEGACREARDDRRRGAKPSSE